MKVNWKICAAAITLFLGAACRAVPSTLSRGEAEKAAQASYDTVTVAMATWRYEREGSNCADVRQNYNGPNFRDSQLIRTLLEQKLVVLEDKPDANGNIQCFSVPTPEALDASQWSKRDIISANSDFVLVRLNRLKVDEVLGVSQASGAITATAQLRLIKEPTAIGTALGLTKSSPQTVERELQKFDDGWRVARDLAAEENARDQAMKQRSLSF